jgi:hypothetical protein
MLKSKLQHYYIEAVRLLLVRQVRAPQSTTDGGTEVLLNADGCNPWGCANICVCVSYVRGVVVGGVPTHVFVCHTQEV